MAAEQRPSRVDQSRAAQIVPPLPQVIGAVKAKEGRSHSDGGGGKESLCSPRSQLSLSCGDLTVPTHRGDPPPVKISPVATSKSTICCSFCPHCQQRMGQDKYSCRSWRQRRLTFLSGGGHLLINALGVTNDRVCYQP